MTEQVAYKQAVGVIRKHGNFGGRRIKTEWVLECLLCGSRIHTHNRETGILRRCGVCYSDPNFTPHTDRVDEIWRPIKGYETAYWVSNYGEIKSDIRVMRQAELPKGYRFVTLYDSTVSQQLYVHRIVAEAFIPNLENKLEVNHKDGDKRNNHVDNLEWNTPSENLKHSYDYLGRQCKPRKGTNHHLSKPVIGISSSKGIVIFSSRYEARNHGFSPRHIRASIKGERPHHRNYRWEYITKEEYFILSRASQ